MTRSQIKAELRRRRRTRRAPWSLAQLAKLRGCDRAVMTRALQDPSRYADARAFIEATLRDRRNGAA